MSNSLRRWLLHRRNIRIQPGWWANFQQKHGWRQGFQKTLWKTIARDLDRRVFASLPVYAGPETRVIDLSDTLADHDKTRTMETSVVRVDRATVDTLLLSAK